MDLISITQAAELIGYSIQSVHRFVKERKLTSYQPSGRKGKIFLKRKEVENFIQTNATEKEVTNG